MWSLKFIARRFFPLVLLAHMSLSLPLRIATGAQSTDDSEIRVVIDSFFGAFQKKDVDLIMTLWSQKPADLASTRYGFEQTLAGIDKIHIDARIRRRIEISHDHATVLVAAEISAVDVKTGKAAEGFGKTNRLIELAREGGAWKIRRYVSGEEDLAASLSIAKTDEERKTLLDANSDLITAELDRRVVAAANQILPQAQYQHVLDLLLLAQHIAIDLNDQAGLATTLRTMGTLQKNHGFYDRALESYQRGITIFEEIDDKAGLAAAANGVGIVYDTLGNYPMALKNYHRSLDIARDIGDKARIARELNNIGLTEREQSDYVEAMKYYQQSLGIEEEVGDAAAVAGTLENMGVVQTEQGNYAQSLALSRKGLRIAAEVSRQDLVCRLLDAIALVEYYQGNYPQAAEYYRQALELSEKIDDKDSAAYCLVSMGTVKTREGSYAQAEVFFQRGLKLGEDLGDKAVVAAAVNDIGTLRREQGKRSEALKYFQRALKLEADLSDKSDTAATLTEIAETYNALGEYSLAVEAAGQSVRLAERIGFPEYLVAALVAKAKACRAMRKIEQARAALSESISTLEGLRSRVGGGASEREHFLEGQMAPYYAMANLLLDQGSADQAFALAERSKARTLIDVLESGKVNVTRAMTADEKAREQEVSVTLASVNGQLLREKLRDQPDPSRVAELDSKLQKARFEQEAFQTGLYDAHPEIRVQRAEFQPLSLKQCSGLIPEAHTALLEFLVSEDRTDVFVLTKVSENEDVPKLTAFTIKVKQKDLTGLLERFRERLARRDPTSYELSAQIYDLLLRPLSRELTGKSNLIIVPDQALWELPFHALQSSFNHYLVQDHAISYAPSLTALREMQNLKPRREVKQAQLVAFANPLLSKATSTGIQETFMGASLQPLPQAETQVRLLAQMFGSERSEVHIGPDATEDRLKAERRTYRELYIAAHGIVNNASPMYSQILLSQAQGSEDDGILEAWEVVNMDVKADLVVLSACSTAGGKVGPGEGMIGLSWAFFIAGCPATMVSQWDVDADSTTQLMIEFHRQMLAGKSKAQALKQAELKLLKGTQYSNPFYWAPFVIVGDGL